jgi:hypothetical protein
MGLKEHIHTMEPMHTLSACTRTHHSSVLVQVMHLRQHLRLHSFLGLTPDQALMWGPINSMSVVQKVGAQEGLLTREKLEEFLKNAPEDYKPKKIN